LLSEHCQKYGLFISIPNTRDENGQYNAQFRFGHDDDFEINQYFATALSVLPLTERNLKLIENRHQVIPLLVKLSSVDTLLTRGNAAAPYRTVNQTGD